MQRYRFISMVSIPPRSIFPTAIRTRAGRMLLFKNATSRIPGEGLVKFQACAVECFT